MRPCMEWTSARKGMRVIKIIYSAPSKIIECRPHRRTDDTGRAVALGMVLNARRGERVQPDALMAPLATGGPFRSPSCEGSGTVVLRRSVDTLPTTSPALDLSSPL
jgi:hypothetical protein